MHVFLSWFISCRAQLESRTLLALGNATMSAPSSPARRAPTTAQPPTWRCVLTEVGMRRGLRVGPVRWSARPAPYRALLRSPWALSREAKPTTAPWGTRKKVLYGPPTLDHHTVDPHCPGKPVRGNMKVGTSRVHAAIWCFQSA